MDGDGIDAVRAMYDDHAADLFAYLARRVGRAVAEDVLGETFRAAIESQSTYDPGRGDRRGWLFGIATNLVRRHWHVERRRLMTLERLHAGGELADTIESLDDSVAGRIDAHANASRLLAAVCELPPDDRDLLVLVGWEQMSSREVGAVLGIEPGAVRTRLHRIRRHLRLALGAPSTTDAASNTTPDSRTTGAPS